MKILLAPLSLSLMMFVPNVVSACPYCAGSDGGEYLSAIAAPILTLLTAPIAIFFIGAVIVWRHDKDNPKDEEFSDQGRRAKNSPSAPAGQS